MEKREADSLLLAQVILKAPCEVTIGLGKSSFLVPRFAAEMEFEVFVRGAEAHK